MEIVKKAAKLLEQCPNVAVSSVNENGYPRICVLGKTKAEGIKKIWFTTGLGGTKSKHFAANPKASACFWKDSDSVTLVGTAEIKTDRKLREEMWNDGLSKHFAGGIDDPDYCVLEFTASEEGTFYIDNEFVTLGGEELV